MEAVVHVITLFIVWRKARNAQHDPKLQTRLALTFIPSAVLVVLKLLPVCVCVGVYVCLGGGC